VLMQHNCITSYAQEVGETANGTPLRSCRRMPPAAAAWKLSDAAADTHPGLLAMIDCNPASRSIFSGDA